MGDNTKDFPLHAALMATTGRLIIKGGFEAFHGLSEHLLGHPIWSHEFGTKTTAAAVKSAARAAFPDLPTEVPPCPEGASYEAILLDWLGGLEAIHGKAVSAPFGSHVRTEGPISTLATMLGKSGEEG